MTYLEAQQILTQFITEQSSGEHQQELFEALEKHGQGPDDEDPD